MIIRTLQPEAEGEIPLPAALFFGEKFYKRGWEMWLTLCVFPLYTNNEKVGTAVCCFQNIPIMARKWCSARVVWIGAQKPIFPYTERFGHPLPPGCAW